MSAFYRRILDHALGAMLRVEFTTSGREVLDYSGVLLVDRGGLRTVSVFTAAQGFNDMHRHTEEGGKRPGTAFHGGTSGGGMSDAIQAAEGDVGYGYDGWGR